MMGFDFIFILIFVWITVYLMTRESKPKKPTQKELDELGDTLKKINQDRIRDWEKLKKERDEALGIRPNPPAKPKEEIWR